MEDILTSLFGGSRSRGEREMRALAERIDWLTDELRDHVPGFEPASRRRQLARSARHGGRAGLDALTEATRSVRDHTGRALHDRPGASLGLVLGFGIVIGLLLSRR